VAVKSLSIELKGNFSEIAKELHALGRRVYPACGRAMRLAMEDEYEHLLYKTPQWSGRTVASYRMGFRAPIHVEESIEPWTNKYERADSRNNPGSMVAVNMALGAYQANPLTDEFEKWRNADVTVTNGNIDGWQVSEHGPVRDVNEPVGAFNDFEGRLRELIINVDISKDLV
jgi:hypothetical protein